MSLRSAYAPDGRGFFVAVTPHAFVVLGADVAPTTAAMVWLKLRHGGFSAVIESLTGAFGNSLAAIPSFAFVAAEEDGLRVAVRGEMQLVIETRSEGVSISGHGSATWREKAIPGAVGVSFPPTEGTDPASDLPIDSGVVRVSALTARLDGSPQSGAPSSAPNAASTFNASAAQPPPASVPAIPEPLHNSPPVPVGAGSTGPALPEDTIRSERRRARNESHGDHGGDTERATRTASGSPAPPRPPRSNARVRLSSGEIVIIDRPLIVGRRPRAVTSSGKNPILIAVESPQQDISRSHVEIRSEGEHLFALDLATTNGTVLRRSDRDPVRLHPRELTMLVAGDVIDIGDGVTVTVEAIA